MKLLDVAKSFIRSAYSKKRTVRAPRVSNFGNERFSYTGYSRHGADSESLPLESWFVFPSSPRDDCDKNQYTLRARSRDLYMHDAFVGAILHAKRDGVIGRGLDLDAKVDAEALGIDLDTATEYERRIEAAFIRWSREAGSNGESFIAVMRDAYFSAMLNGDCIADIYCNVESGTLRIRLIESDCLLTPSEKSAESYIRSGVELNSYGTPVAYWLATAYENNSDGETPTFYRRPAFRAGFNNRATGEFVPPSGGAILIHTPHERVGQIRGLPVVSRVMRDAKQLNRYMEAELDAAVVASKPALFRTHPAVDAQAEVDMYDSFGEPVCNVSAAAARPEPLSYGNGLMIDLMDGEGMQAFNPVRPNPAYTQFVDHKLCEIAAALGIPASVAKMKFDASYSASRAELLAAQKGFEIDRALFVDQFVRPVYNAWLDLNADSLGLEGYYTDPVRRSAWRSAEWIGEQLPSIDPSVDAAAAKARVDMCLSTLSREAQIATGSDISANIRQRGYEERLMREFGLVKDQNGMPVEIGSSDGGLSSADDE